MKKLLVVMIVLFAASVFGQSSAKPMQELQNYNWNWGRSCSDTLRVTTKIDTVALTGKAYNLLIWPINGDVTFKLSNDSRFWPHWMTIPNGQSISISGGDVDSLFLKSAGAITTNIIYSSF